MFSKNWVVRYRFSFFEPDHLSVAQGLQRVLLAQNLAVDLPFGSASEASTP
jgi:hypothetical protein